MQKGEGDRMNNGILLLVDDDPSFGRLFERVCAGQRVVLACNLEDGVRLAAALDPEYVFLDVRFEGPFRTGIDAIAEVKKAAPFTKVVIVTAAPNDYDHDRAIAAGAVAYCDKRSLVTDGGLVPRELERATLRAARRRLSPTTLPWKRAAIAALAAAKK